MSRAKFSRSDGDGKEIERDSSTGRRDDWETESALRTLLEAEKIEKNPDLMKVRALAKSKLMEVASIASGEGEKN